MRWKLSCTLTIATLLFGRVGCHCYLNCDYQGDFQVQVSSAVLEPSGHRRITYVPVRVEADGIPIYGRCHRKMGDTVILREESSGCFRCLRFVLRSANVLELLSAGRMEQCFTREEDALNKACPRTDVSTGHTHMMLFRVPTDVVPVLCPFSHGSHLFSYSRDVGASSSEVCPQLASSLSTCPEATQIHVHFSGCSFPDESRSLTCIGQWRKQRGIHGEMFVAFLEEGGEHGHTFRCGIYRESPDGIQTWLTLSNDSTCQNELSSATFGHETFTLKKVPLRPWPNIVTKDACRFPLWLQGQWEDFSADGSVMFHRDLVRNKTYTSHCVQRSQKYHNRYLIYSISQCGEAQYNCVWFERRSANVVEYQLGTRPSTIPSFKLCRRDHFMQRTWKTEAKKSFTRLSSCPITGEYTGHLPDAPTTMCAKMSSDCNNPDIIFYSVASCTNMSEVFEDREYQCMGQWEENGLLYAYVRRRDIEGYECFVGEATKPGGEGVSLIEGGRNCKRGLRVSDYGMRLSKRSKCFGQPDMAANGLWYIPSVGAAPSSSPDLTIPARTTFVIREEDIQDLSTKPWMPITDNPSSSASATLHCLSALVLLVRPVVQCFLF